MAQSEEDSRIHFRFERSRYFRRIHCDGAWGTVTPDGSICMGVVSEALELPREVVRELLPDGSAGKVVADDDDDLFVVRREIEAELILSPRAAANIMNWLRERLESICESDGEGDGKPGPGESDE